MQSRRTYRPIIRQLATLLIMPLMMTGAVYALFSQNLSVNSTGSSVSYVASNSMLMTYVSSSTGTGPYTYTINPLTLYNNGVNDTAQWTVTFVVPSDVSSVTCAAAVVACTYNNTTKTLTVKNVLANGWIKSGTSRVISGANIQFSTSTPRYTLQTVTVTSTNYLTITGLSTTITNKRSGSNYTLTIKITTAAGVTVNGWQIKIPTTTACTNVTNLPATVTALCTATELVLSAPVYAIAANTTITLSPSPVVTYSPKTWNTTTATIKGKY